MTHDTRGTTLIELMAAMFVLTVVLLSALAFAVSNVKNEVMGVTRLKTTNLAREGAEIARAIRDSNWLAGETWDKGLFPNGSWQTHACAILGETDIKNATFDFTADQNCTQPLTGDVYRMYYKTDTGFFYQKAGGAEVGSEIVPSAFRKITLDFICVDNNSETSCDNMGQEDAIGVKVTTEVSSLVHGRPVVNSVVEKLYNWR